MLRDANDAWRELALAWKVTPEGPDTCRALLKEQIQCFSKNLSLSMIRELGRPGVLTLDAESGAPTYALLTALGRDSATLRAGGSEQTVTLAALAVRWRGEFATLWRTPPGYSSRTAAAPQAETTRWVGTALATANGTPPPVQAQAFDTALRNQLRAFQLARGLGRRTSPSHTALVLCPTSSMLSGKPTRNASAIRRVASMRRRRARAWPSSRRAAVSHPGSSLPVRCC